MAGETKTTSEWPHGCRLLLRIVVLSILARSSGKRTGMRDSSGHPFPSLFAPFPLQPLTVTEAPGTSVPLLLSVSDDGLGLISQPEISAPKYVLIILGCLDASSRRGFPILFLSKRDFASHHSQPGFGDWNPSTS